MKDKTLLSINNYYYLRGGAEYVFLRHNDLLDQYAWRIVPFAMQHPDNLYTPWSRYFASEIEYAHKYRPIEKLTLISKAIYSFEARRKLRRVIDRAKPDIAHCHNIYHHLSPAILPELHKCGIKTVMTLHDLKIACPAYTMLTHDGVCERCKKHKVYNAILHRCLKNNLALSAVITLESGLHRLLDSYQANVDRFIVPSFFYKQKFAEWGFNEKQLIHIPNFVEHTNYQPGSIKQNSILYFGRLAQPKGLITLIKAAKLANMRIQIAGRGPQEQYLREFASKTGAEVTFTGFLSGKALYDSIRQAKATVLPSEWYENAPISILESYALGTAVIGANIGGIPELIKNGKTGFTFESGDADSLADRLREINQISTRAAIEMGRSGRKWVETQFTSALYLKRINRLYAALNNRLA